MVRIFADGADLRAIEELRDSVDGFTTNPSLMKKAGITDYRGFAMDVLRLTGKPVSFEVLADDWGTMESQAREIHSWAENVYVKIPVTNCAGESSCYLINRLATDGIKVNVTAVFTLDQVSVINDHLVGTPAIVSVFAGRIADSGIDPEVIMSGARSILRRHELLWASPREAFNVQQAERCGCDIITCGPELISKLRLIGKDLEEYSRETVTQFFADARGLIL